MKKTLFTLFLALVASVGTMFASETQVDGIWYNFNNSTMTAYVTYHGSSYYNYDEYSDIVTIPSSVEYTGKTYSVTSIGDDAFRSCMSLKSVTIPNSVTSIGSMSFYGCSGLQSVTIPNSVTSIGKEAFSFCSSLASIVVENGNATYDSRNNCNAIIETASNILLLGCKNTAIPNSVTSIGNYAFSNCDDLTSCTIPNSVISIGDHAFHGCTNLTSVTIGDNVISIGEEAFDYCSSLTSVTIPNSVTSIGKEAFYYCTGLTSVHINDIAAWCRISFGYSYSYNRSSNPLEYAHHLYLDNTEIKELIIPNSVTSIGEHAFSGCTGLTSVDIPNSVTSIGSMSFYSCFGLQSVTIPNSVTSIGNSAFSGCSGLTSVTIPNSVTKIGYRIFYGCSGLTSVAFPSSVTEIGDMAFYDCLNLQNINMNAVMPPTIKSSTFGNIHSNAIVYVPFGAQKYYSTASYWKNMKYSIANIDQEITYSPTSCTIAFNVEDIELQSCGIEGGEMSDGNTLEYIGLEPNTEYKDIPVVLTSNTDETETINVSFTTTTLELTTNLSKPVSSNTAILLAETNMADAEVSCGFEWKRNDAPEDFEATKVFCPVANGTMAGRLKGLKDDVYYKYRAFYQSAAGNMYYGDWKYIFTGDNAVEFDPVLYTYPASAVTETEATLKGYALEGSDDFNEQGFEYWADSRVTSSNAPARKSVIGDKQRIAASGIAMKVTLSDLDEGTVYKYRTYAQIGDQTVYGAEMSFTTKGEYQETMAIDDMSTVNSQLSTKLVRDGQLFILRDGKVYTILGQEVE